MGKDADMITLIAYEQGDIFRHERLSLKELGELLIAYDGYKGVRLVITDDVSGEHVEISCTLEKS